jgi:mRNA-degrading endonuclease toxin of MazEF toxin-antitoxin module
LRGQIAKRRPVIVVSPTEMIEKMPEVLTVACTSTIYPSDTTAIELPNRERMPQTKTGLNKRTWAVPEWILPVHRDLLTDYIGHASGATLRRLLEAVAKKMREGA